jgi:hypothetical protein
MGAEARTKNAMIAGLTPANLRAYAPTVGGAIAKYNGRFALYLGLLALAEIAEYGTIGGDAGLLENASDPFGYTSEISDAINNLIMAMNAIN